MTILSKILLRIPLTTNILSTCFITTLNITNVFSQNNNFYFNHINVNQGLSSNQVNCIYKDNKGFIWFGTMAGLNRFDGHNFKIYRHEIEDSNSISDNYVENIFEDHLGRLWIDTHQEINIYDPRTEQFTIGSMDKMLDGFGINSYYITNIFKDVNSDFWYIDSRSMLFKYDTGKKLMKQVPYFDKNTFNASLMSMTAIEEDMGGQIWVMTTAGYLFAIDPNEEKVVYSNQYISRQITNENTIFKLFSDMDNNLWINATNDALGIFHFDTRKREFEHFTQNRGRIKLNTNIINGISQDDDGNIWVATDHGGINLIDRDLQSIRFLLHNQNDNKSIGQNSITSIYKDNTGIIWLGTFKRGVSYYHSEIIKFRAFSHVASNPNSLIMDDVNCFAEDSNGNIWIGTNGGGLDYFDRNTGKFTHFEHQPNNPNSLSNNIIVSLMIDHEGILWIGTYYGGLNSYDGKNFRRYVSDPNDPKSIADNRIWAIFEDSGHNLWIGTLGGGLDLYDRKNNVFQHHKAEDNNSIGSNYVSCIDEDSMGKLWIGTADGISIIDRKSQNFSYIAHNSNNPNGLSNNNINILRFDNRGFLWIGTREGLNVYNPKDRTFKTFRKDNGLPDNVISTLIFDDNHHVWLGTPNGISNLIITDKRFDSLKVNIKNYDESDGLQGVEFNKSAALITGKGELIFGGANGFNIIQPEKIKLNIRLPKIVFTEFLLFNHEIKVNKEVNGKVLLSQNITDTKEIVLNHSENMFSVGFAALNYFQPEKNTYKYKLIGFNDDYLICDKKTRRVTYTNLDPGKYTFHVMASNNDGFWNEEGATLKIIIRPPLWKTTGAKVFYVILSVILLFLLRYLILKRERQNFRIQQEKQKVQRRHELDLLKIKFFTNISHEFKTPLALIISPLEKIMKNTHDPSAQEQFKLIYRNARRLLNLVNKLLDFRRMENREIKLTPMPGDIVSFVREMTYSFSDLSEKNGIVLNFGSSIDRLDTYFDHDKMEKIIFNLLSNAFKFTEEKGRIDVNIDLETKPNLAYDGTSGNKNEYWILLKVSDTGIGISEEKKDKIFERFFQDDIPGNLLNQGSGIGLSLVHEFVRLHKGDIQVESTPGKGSTFIVKLPVTKETDLKKINIPIKNNTENIALPPLINQDLPLVLIVEDNDDFRFYLKDNLKSGYNIIEAPDGLAGLNKAKENKPDLIVSDVMMPNMDGIELCRKLKTDPVLSNTPVILLTAITSENQKVKSFDYGADDYITKPFSFEILESRIKNLIAKHNILQKSLKRKIDITLGEIEITSKDEILIKKALDLVEKNLSNPEFSVEGFSREIGMSRVHLYKKLSSLTGKTPIEFIRIVRLKRAAQLLEKSQMSVSEVAYKVGFNNPKYFTKYFKAEYKMLPSVYAQKNLESNTREGKFEV